MSSNIRANNNPMSKAKVQTQPRKPPQNDPLVEELLYEANFRNLDAIFSNKVAPRPKSLNKRDLDELNPSSTVPEYPSFHTGAGNNTIPVHTNINQSLCGPVTKQQRHDNSKRLHKEAKNHQHRRHTDTSYESSVPPQSSQKAPDRDPKYDNPCTDFLLGRCKRKNCKYSHKTDDTTTTAPPVVSKLPCREYQQGRCFREACRFSHHMEGGDQSDTCSIDSVKIDVNDPTPDPPDEIGVYTLYMQPQATLGGLGFAVITLFLSVIVYLLIRWYLNAIMLANLGAFICALLCIGIRVCTSKHRSKYVVDSINYINFRYAIMFVGELYFTWHIVWLATCVIIIALVAVVYHIKHISDNTDFDYKASTHPSAINETSALVNASSKRDYMADYGYLNARSVSIPNKLVEYLRKHRSGCKPEKLQAVSCMAALSRVYETSSDDDIRNASFYHIQSQLKHQIQCDHYLPPTTDTIAHKTASWWRGK